METIETLRPGESIHERHQDERHQSVEYVLIEYKSRQFPFEERLGSLGNQLLRLDAPLYVTLNRDEGQVVAECEEFQEFGYGPNVTEAIKDLQSTIVELYFTLKNEQDNLAGRLPELWGNVSAKIKER